MIAWAYATAGERSEEVFGACTAAVLAGFESVDIRVRPPATGLASP